MVLAHIVSRVCLHMITNEDDSKVSHSETVDVWVGGVSFYSIYIMVQATLSVRQVMSYLSLMLKETKETMQQ